MIDGAEGHPTMHWYALSCHPNSDRKVGQKLGLLGIEAFYPHRTIPARHGRREAEQRFFPGYVFARFDLNIGARAVATIPQVVGILGYGSPTPIPEREVEAVRRLVNSPQVTGAIHSVPLEGAEVGDRVRVLYGPLVGLEGFISSRKGRVLFRVGIEMMGRAVGTEIDGAALEWIGSQPRKAA